MSHVPIIYEPPSANYEAEYRYTFTAKAPAGPHVVVQGSVWTAGHLDGDKDNSEDDTDKVYEVRLLVGPHWRDVQAVVPSVTIIGFRNHDADDCDQEAWEITDLTWDTVGELGVSNDELRIRLKVTVVVRGQSSHVDRLGYYLFARGRNLGAEGIDSPGPVKKQG